MENLFAQLHHAAHHGRAAGNDHTRSNHLFHAAAAQFLQHQLIQFHHARLDDFCQRLHRELTRLATIHARHFYYLARFSQLAQRATMLDFDVFCRLRWRAERHRNIVGNLVASHANHCGVANRTALEHGDVRGAAANIHQTHA